MPFTWFLHSWKTTWCHGNFEPHVTGHSDGHKHRNLFWNAVKFPPWNGTVNLWHQSVSVSKAWACFNDWCFSLSACIDFPHLGEKQTHIHCNGTSSAFIGSFLREVKAWNASTTVDSKHRRLFSGNECVKCRGKESTLCFEVCVWSWSSFPPTGVKMFSVTMQ